MLSPIKTSVKIPFHCLQAEVIMNPRERVRLTLDHQTPDRVPLDLSALYQAVRDARETPSA